MVLLALEPKHTDPLRVTHPKRDTICSTVGLPKVTITKSFCVTKTHTGKSQSPKHEVNAVKASQFDQ